MVEDLKFLKSLEAIANTEEGQKCERAKELLARYREVNSSFFFVFS